MFYIKSLEENGTFKHLSQKVQTEHIVTFGLDRPESPFKHYLLMKYNVSYQGRSVVSLHQRSKSRKHFETFVSLACPEIFVRARAPPSRADLSVKRALHFVSFILRDNTLEYRDKYVTLDSTYRKNFNFSRM